MPPHDVDSEAGVADRAPLEDITRTRLSRPSSEGSRGFVSAIVDRSPSPAVAVYDSGTTYHANGLFEAISGHPDDELVGRDLVTTLVPKELQPQARLRLERALAGDSAFFTLTLESAAGAWTEVLVEALVLDQLDRHLLLLTVREAKLVRESRHGTAYGGHSYVVRLSRAGLRIDDSSCTDRALRDHDLVRCETRYGEGDQGCTGCPASAAIRQNEPLVGVLESSELDRYVMVKAVPLGDARARVERVTIDGASVSLVLRARIDRLAARAGLSSRERDVLEILILGRTLEDVGTLLGVTRHTAKFHQANILQKLGADTRFDLLRVLL